MAELINSNARSLSKVNTLTFLELIDAHERLHSYAPISQRLRHILLRHGNRLPFHTIGEYIDAGSDGQSLMMRLPAFGRKTLDDLHRVIAEANDLFLEMPADIAVETLSEEKNLRINTIRAMSFPELINQSIVSKRLRNCITTGSESLPFLTVGEYLDSGEKGVRGFKAIANFGSKCALELDALVKDVTSNSSGSITPTHNKNLAMIDELEFLYPGVFEPLIESYQSVPESEMVLCQKYEKQIQKILSTPRDADICRRRFEGATLESVAKDPAIAMTRERVRQIEAKYKGLVTNIYSETWLIPAIHSLLAKQESQIELPSNEQLAARHPNMLLALRKVFHLENHGNAALSSAERFDLAKKLGLDTNKELINSSRWTVQKLIHELKAFAQEIGKPDLMPMQLEMRARGRNDLNGAVGRFGGQSKVAELAGLIYQGQKVAEDGSRTYWTDERIGQFLHEVAAKEGHPDIMPTIAECQSHAPNPNTIITIITRSGLYGKGLTWLEVARQHGLKYDKVKHRVTLRFVRAFVQSLGDALHTLTPSEIYVLFEQQGINKSGKNASRERQFDNLVAAMQSGNLPREEVKRWASGGQADLVEALLDPEIESVEDAYASIGESYPKKDHKSKLENKQDDEYREDLEQNLPAPRAIETLASLEKASELLVQTSSDEEALNFLVAKAAGKLWRRCFEDEAAAIEEAKQHQGNQYSELARDTFLEEYTRSKQLPLPAGYAFKDADGEVRRPKLMQLLIAYKVIRDGRVLNLSGTGTGKTLSAILASRVIGSQLTVISCPNATVPGWGQAIRNAFPDSDVCEKTWQPEWGSLGYPRYLVLNHEMFQDRTEGALKRFIEANAIDFVVIDELHQVKQRDPQSESQRRRMINGLITDVPDNRPKPRVLGMSATPIINNLQEGKSLIELVSSLEHRDIQTETNVQNCMKLYQKFTTMGFRMMPKYRSDRIPKIHPVDCTPSLDALLALGTKPHPQQVEAILVRARWPVISQYLRPKTVVFTDYVKDIIPFLVEATKQAGFSVGVYTGDEKLATEIGFADMLDQFKHGEVDVLLASIKTAGTGIDGLQFICNNVIFATLPWTNTDYEQAVGRFDREGFKFNSLDIHIPKTYAVLSEGGEWSWCDAKLRRIENKRDIAKAAVDGEIPDTTSQLTPEKAAGYWMGWLKRLTEEGIAEFDRKSIRVPLDETDKVQNQRRLAEYGELPKLRSHWSEELSHKTHERLQENPEEWCYFQTKLQEQEREWQHIPRNECIKHIIENLSLGSVVGDFGCGQAQLAIALRDEYTVHSFDHVAISPSVVACDMAHTPLDDSILDVAVYCLSLVGANVKDYLVEAYRTLKPSGQLLIYHPTENADRQKFVVGLERFGFAVVKQEQMDQWHYVWAIKRGRQAELEVEIRF
ncbi:hypothetical protein OYT1_ch1391 [Ferriphaselus amnicola]|uniref:Helicase ATP-binding domain-containing protein n=1 Tax=Ferriphaselus amnicola TaxID=1188319 RepID=A0A2Z6GBS4_9PROT|nr:helicase-related protein [Ferriphaselus amnicola]BBE50948.1 hypothetical protein OYT1_ch1391 [Ferriphaselus amnicola]